MLRSERNDKCTIWGQPMGNKYAEVTYNRDKDEMYAVSYTHLVKYFKQEDSRLKRIGWSLLATRRRVKEIQNGNAV